MNYHFGFFVCALFSVSIRHTFSWYGMCLVRVVTFIGPVRTELRAVSHASFRH